MLLAQRTQRMSANGVDAAEMGFEFGFSPNYASRFGDTHGPESFFPLIVTRPHRYSPRHPQ